MSNEIVRVEGNSGKVYELTSFDAMDKLEHCRVKAACLAILAPKLESEGHMDPTSAPVQGLAFILEDLADDLNAVSRVLWATRKGQGGDGPAKVANLR
jgi:hypothetical protein